VLARRDRLSITLAAHQGYRWRPVNDAAPVASNRFGWEPLWPYRDHDAGRRAGASGGVGKSR